MQQQVLRLGRALFSARVLAQDDNSLAASAGAAAAHAAVTASVAGHDGAADVAAGGVAHVDQLFQGVGSVDVSGDGSARDTSARAVEQ